MNMRSKIIITVILTLSFGITRAQQPDLLPPAQTDPIELTPFNIIVYFIMPAAIFVTYYLYRKSKKKN